MWCQQKPLVFWMRLQYRFELCLNRAGNGTEHYHTGQCLVSDHMDSLVWNHIFSFSYIFLCMGNSCTLEEAWALASDIHG